MHNAWERRSFYWSSNKSVLAAVDETALAQRIDAARASRKTSKKSAMFT